MHILNWPPAVLPQPDALLMSWKLTRILFLLNAHYRIYNHYVAPIWEIIVSVSLQKKRFACRVMFQFPEALAITLSELEWHAMNGPMGYKESLFVQHEIFHLSCIIPKGNKNGEEIHNSPFFALIVMSRNLMSGCSSANSS